MNKHLNILAIATISLLSCSFIISNHKRVNASQLEKIVIRYNPDELRIPGSKFEIGVSALLKNGDMANTKGYLNGDTRWTNYKIEVDKGYYAFGKIHLKNNIVSRKGETIEVKIYMRRSKKLVKTQHIPLNYETNLQIITRGKFNKAPGNKVDIGFTYTYDNGKEITTWPALNRDIDRQFTTSTDGADLSWGNLIIKSDPFEIRQHTVRLIAASIKSIALTDTLEIILDYRDNFRCTYYGSSGMNGASGWSGTDGSTGCNGGHGGNGSDGYDGYDGPNIEVFTDVYFDTIINEQLLYLEVNEVGSGALKRYLVNTDGGTITIRSYGGDGGDGGNGGRGGNGGSGYSGSWVKKKVWDTDSTYHEVDYQLAGGDGGNGGDGGHGGNGGYGGFGGNIYVDFTAYAEPYLHLIDPRSIGGSGGWGGSGGSSGSGGSGGSGNPSGSSGSSGHSGSSGWNGSSGGDGEVFFQRVE